MTFANMFDIGAACVMGFFVIRGTLRGLTGEIVSLVGLVASVFCGWTFAKPLATLAGGYFPTLDATIAELICAVAIFMAVSLVFAALGKMLRAFIKAVKLSFLDHGLGALAGAVRAFVVIILIYGVLTIFSPAFNSDWMEESVVMKQAAVVWPVFLRVMTDNGWIDVTHLTPATWTYPTPR